jgi:hypothetical protein
MYPDTGQGRRDYRGAFAFDDALARVSLATLFFTRFFRKDSIISRNPSIV